MNDTAEKKQEMSPKELKALREELWFILPFFLYSLYMFFGCFRYKFEARTVPLIISIPTAILTGMRLYHIIFPKSKLGQFKEAGISGEFDALKDEIKEETLKGIIQEEEPAKEITFRDEKKAFIAIIGCFFAYLLFGYLVGMVFVTIGTSYYYGYKKMVPILVSLGSMFAIVYVILYKLMGAPAYWGILLEPILTSLGLI